MAAKPILRLSYSCSTRQKPVLLFISSAIARMWPTIWTAFKSAAIVLRRFKQSVVVPSNRTKRNSACRDLNTHLICHHFQPSIADFVIFAEACYHPATPPEHSPNKRPAFPALIKVASISNGTRSLATTAMEGSLENLLVYNLTSNAVHTATYVPSLNLFFPPLTHCFAHSSITPKYSDTTI